MGDIGLGTETMWDSDYGGREYGGREYGEQRLWGIETIGDRDYVGQ